MQQPPPLTDRAALSRQRRRSKDDALFLHDIAADEIKERLQEVNRAFTDIAIVTGHPSFWRKAVPKAQIVPDDDRLDLPAHSFDLAIHAIAMHWANDPVGQLIQLRNALRPDGLALVACFGGQTLAELRAVLSQAETDITGGLSPRILPMGEIRDMGALLARAGFALPVADALPLRVSYENLRALFADLRKMGERNAMAGRHKIPPNRRIFDRAARLYADQYAVPDDPNRIQATFELIFLTGWAPHESQQKPLRPGSGQTPLSQALSPDFSPEHGGGKTLPD